MQCMLGGLQEEPVEYGVSMPSSPLTDQAAFIVVSIIELNKTEPMVSNWTE